MTKIAGFKIGAAAIATIIAVAGLSLVSAHNGARAADIATPAIQQTASLNKQLEARLDAEMDAELRRLTAAGAADVMCPVEGHGIVSYSGHNPDIVGVSQKPEQVAETGSPAAK